MFKHHALHRCEARFEVGAELYFTNSNAGLGIPFTELMHH